MARHAPHGDYDYPHEDLWCEDFTPPRHKPAPRPSEAQRFDDLAFRLDYLERAIRTLSTMVQELSRQRTHLQPTPDPAPPFPGTPEHGAGPDD